MTVSTEDFRWAYTSTGGTTYQYLNKILDEDDLAVYVDGVLQAIGTDYSVTGVGTAAGGNVVFGAAPAAASIVLITKDGVEFTQEHDYTENDPFPASSHEDALDKQTNLAQKIWDYVRRSVKVAITSTLTDLELPTPSAGKYLGWNDTATGLSNLTPTSLGSISDDAYSSTAWDGASEVAPSKNAVRDEMETKMPLTGYAGNVSFLGINTATGSTGNIANATPTTIFSAAANSMYVVFAYIASAGSANYTAYAFVLSEGTDARIASGDGGLLTLTISGLNIQTTQSTGGIASVSWKSLKIV